MSFLSIPVRALLRLNLIIILYFWLLRLAFAFIFVAGANDFTTSDFLKSFYLGMKFDVRMGFISTLPFALLLILFNLQKPKFEKWVSRLYFVIFFIITTVMFLDIGFYSYLNTRINSSAFQFATNPWISLQMMWETYPLLTITFFILVFSYILFRLMKKYVFNMPWQHTPFRMRVSSALIALVIYLIGMYGKFSYYPLRWSEAFYTDNPFLIALGINPILYANDTLQASKERYDINKVKKHYKQISEYLRLPEPNQDELNFTRPVVKTPLTYDTAPNIVVIVLESFGAYKTHLTDHPLDPAPFFKEISQQGVLFDQFYTPTEGTARGIFNLVSGVPDIMSFKTASRNPLVVNQNSPARALENYDKLYFLGGSANWGEIRGVIARGIPGINIYEEGDYSSPRVDVWGISDLHLFEEANSIFSSKKAHKPFFALIQSSGFHRPYTIPEDRRGFKENNVTDEEAKKYGFVSAKEYQSLRFQDHALKVFFDQARKSKYFENTIFVITADHGLPDFNAQHLPTYYKAFELSRFHSPLLFYSPKYFPEPRVDSSLASTQDILVSLVGLLGLPFENKSMGRNLFAPNYERGALMYTYHSTPAKMSFMSDQFIVVGSKQRGMEKLFDYTSDNPKKDVKSEYPDEFKRLKNLAEGIYETSRYMLYHNN
jgi:phosphoglycerol transferase MdoB-like AlkP superfamily enzyme